MRGMADYSLFAEIYQRLCCSCHESLSPIGSVTREQVKSVVEVDLGKMALQREAAERLGVGVRQRCASIGSGPGLRGWYSPRQAPEQ